MAAEVGCSVFCTESTLSARWRSAGADIRDPERRRNEICDYRRRQLVAPLWNIQFREIRHFCSAITTESKSENSCGRFFLSLRTLSLSRLKLPLSMPRELRIYNIETRRASPSVMKYLKPAFAEFARTLDFRLWIFQAASGRFSPGRKMKGARKRGRKELLANWPGEKKEKLFQTKDQKSDGKLAKNFITKIVWKETKEFCTLMSCTLSRLDHDSLTKSLLRVVRQEAFESPQCGWCNCSGGGNVCLFVYCWRVASGAGQMSAAALLLWAAVSREVKQKFSSFILRRRCRETSRLTRASRGWFFISRILLMSLTKKMPKPFLRWRRRLVSIQIYHPAPLFAAMKRSGKFRVTPKMGWGRWREFY